MTLAISIRQPWASLILLAGKDIENRTWSTQVRGRVLIHAAKGMTKVEYADALNFASAIDPDLVRQLVETNKLGPNDLQRGGIIGSVDLVDTVLGRRFCKSPWFQGPWGFVLAEPQPLPFVPIKGRLGFFDVPEVTP